MLMTTTNTLEGTPIQHYLGIVSGEAILGANLMKDLFASVRDIVGGRSAAYEQELIRAKETALRAIFRRRKNVNAAGRPPLKSMENKPPG